MTIDFPSKVDAPWLEAVIARSAGEAGDSVVLRVRDWEEVHALGEGRLLQWMRHLKQGGKRVVLDLAVRLPAIEDDPRHRLWPIFRDRLGAMILVDAADEVLDGEGRDRRSEVEVVQTAKLASEGGEVGFGRERALLRLDRLGAPPGFRVFTDAEDDFAHLGNRVEQLVKALWLKPMGDQLGQLTSFVYELVANTRDHARDDLGGVSIDGIRFAQIRRLSVSRQRGMEQLMTSESRPQAYLERLASSDELEEGVATEFVEVTVADSGVGIPARLRQSMDVYRGPLSKESEVTLEATLVGTSSQPPSVIGSGQGLDTALRMADLLHGLVVVRTGRLELIRDTTQPAPEQDGWHIEERPHLPGTAISLLLPWWAGAQTQLEATVR